ncbi:MAG: hypothetical protein LUH07_10890 [Lachnospiraceae bacterium]|nr:hypothetical protein [Lachnospiraceae bacterium]
MADKLSFPVDQYTLKTQELKYEGSMLAVTYREYRMVTYCANPIDPDYQGMDVWVPVSVNGKDVDTSDSPILINNSIQAYTSWNIRTGIPGRPHPDVRMPGPGEHGGPGGPGGGPDDGTRHVKTDRNFLPLYAMSRGIIIVKPGARGRDNRDANGTYFGKAPAAVVDLKACVRYIRHNKGVFPGNTDKIFSNGASAGGAVSAALGASADYEAYKPYLDAIGAADESDSILGTICHCPIMDLDHADAAYEWMYGPYPGKKGLVDQKESAVLAGIYRDYLKELNIQGLHNFGLIDGDNLGDYIVKEYMLPSADHFLKVELTDSERSEYLAQNPWMKYENGHADFTFEDFTGHVGRMKELCSFDGRGEGSVFGNESTDERHFTDYGAKKDNPDGVVDPEVTRIANLMNPMFFARINHPGCSKHWYFCIGSKDASTSHSVYILFQTLLQNNGMDTSMTFLWDYGHQCSDDPVEMVDWIMKVSEKNA